MTRVLYLSQARVLQIAVPPNRISDIVNGKRAITADTALRLGKYFGVSPEIWLGLQVDYGRYFRANDKNFSRITHLWNRARSRTASQDF